MALAVMGTGNGLRAASLSENKQAAVNMVGPKAAGKVMHY